jgi:hypothetical protein
VQKPCLKKSLHVRSLLVFRLQTRTEITIHRLGCIPLSYAYSNSCKLGLYVIGAISKLPSKRPSCLSFPYAQMALPCAACRERNAMCHAKTKFMEAPADIIHAHRLKKHAIKVSQVTLHSSSASKMNLPSLYFSLAS